MIFNQKQTEILQIAEELFSKNGFEGTSVRDIAHAASINVAMINYYFESKENLLEIIIRRGVEAYKLDASHFNSITDPLARLDLLIEHYIDSKLSNKNVYDILTNEAHVKKRRNNSDIFKDLRKHNIEIIRDVIEYGCQKGVFHYYDPIMIHITMIGTFMNFRNSRPIFEEMQVIPEGQDFEAYFKKTLTQHLKFTIKAILTNENK